MVFCQDGRFFLNFVGVSATNIIFPLNLEEEGALQQSLSIACLYLRLTALKLVS